MIPWCGMTVLPPLRIERKGHPLQAGSWFRKSSGSFRALLTRHLVLGPSGFLSIIPGAGLCFSLFFFSISASSLLSSRLPLSPSSIVLLDSHHLLRNECDLCSN